MHRRALLTILILAVGLVGEAQGQSKGAEKRPEPAKPAAPAPSQPVSIEQTLYLIRSTLMTLNDANRSGNYTVLRDLAAPAFQAKNSAADLAMIFLDLRRRNFDLFTTALAPPQLTAAPALDGNGMLRLLGYYPTRPLQINFELIYQVVNGRWRLFGISVATPEAPQPQANGGVKQGAAATPKVAIRGAKTP